MVLACFESRNLTKRAHHRIGRKSDIGPLLKGDKTEIGKRRDGSAAHRLGSRI